MDCMVHAHVSYETVQYVMCTYMYNFFNSTLIIMQSSTSGSSSTGSYNNSHTADNPCQMLSFTYISAGPLRPRYSAAF